MVKNNPPKPKISLDRIMDVSEKDFASKENVEIAHMRVQYIHWQGIPCAYNDENEPKSVHDPKDYLAGVVPQEAIAVVRYKAIPIDYGIKGVSNKFLAEGLALIPE